MTHTDLIARLKAADGPDRADFCQVMKQVGLNPRDQIWQRVIELCQVKAFTEAALTLIEEELPGHSIEIEIDEGTGAAIGDPKDWDYDRPFACHKYTAIALLIALLTALHGESDG